MSVALLDVNVLVALFDPAHINHDDAHRWFGAHRREGWATCPLTIDGCVRILSHPAYPSIETTPSEVISRLRVLCASADHQFWGDGVSLLDGELIRPEMIGGHKKVTDVYLLGLAVRKRGRLVTFDRAIPLKAVVGAGHSHLDILGSPAK